VKNKTIAVIGAGVGGIVASIHLARQGMKVLVFEKNSRPGGRCDQLIREGHTFDTGPTLLVMPHLYEAEFQAMGVSMQEMLDLLRVDPTYHLIFDDGSQLALTSNMSSMEKQMETFEPGSFRKLQKYLDEGRIHYDLGIEKLVSRDFRKASDFISLKNLPLLFKLKPLVNHYRHMSSFFKNPRLKTAFTFQDVYMGLSPFQAAATFSLMPYSELAHGVYYPRGGMNSLVDALMKLALQAGVEFHFDTTVLRIVVEGNRTNGLILEHGEFLPADVVLANADLPYVYKDLLPADGMNEKLARKDYSCSVISFFWGVDKTYKKVGPHTLFLVDDYRQNFDSIINKLDLPAHPSIYLHAPARLDRSMAPVGQDTLIAIVPVGHLSDTGGKDWMYIRDLARKKVFQRLAKFGMNDLEAHIKFEIDFTPLSWNRRYNLVKGSTHGLSHKLTQLAYFRPHNRHARYKNLYFVGASTHPGTGLPTAMVSGRLAAGRIMDEFPVE
jgi:phytoene desaturase